MNRRGIIIGTAAMAAAAVVPVAIVGDIARPLSVSTGSAHFTTDPEVWLNSNYVRTVLGDSVPWVNGEPDFGWAEVEMALARGIFGLYHSFMLVPKARAPDTFEGLEARTRALRAEYTSDHIEALRLVLGDRAHDELLRILIEEMSAELEPVMDKGAWIHAFRSVRAVRKDSYYPYVGFKVSYAMPEG
jgi:hypothetical protein